MCPVIFVNFGFEFESRNGEFGERLEYLEITYLAACTYSLSFVTAHDNFRSIVSDCCVLVRNAREESTWTGMKTAAPVTPCPRSEPVKKFCMAMVVATTTLCATAPAFADYYHHHHCHTEWHHHHRVRVCH
jgi:hypothetical protein